MSAKNHILVGHGERIYLDAEHPELQSAGSHIYPRLWHQPQNVPLWGATDQRVKFTIRVSEVRSAAQANAADPTGLPAAWSLGVKFQVWTPHTRGHQYEFPEWRDLDTEEVSGLIAEGSPWSTTKRATDTGENPEDGGFGVILSGTNAQLAAASTKARTITDFGLACRIMLDPWSDGSGTTPYLDVSINATRYSS